MKMVLITFTEEGNISDWTWFTWGGEDQICMPFHNSVLR